MRKSVQRWAMMVAGMAALGGAAWAQGEGLGGTMAATGISASMSGMSSSGVVTAGQRMKSSAPRSADALRAGSSSDLTESGTLFGSGSGGSSGGGTAGGAAAAPPRLEPRRWGPQDTGSAILQELLAARQMPPIPSPIGGQHTPAQQAALSRKIKGMTPTQRTKLVMQKYDIRPQNWLAHYQPEDRYKIVAGTWRFVITRTSRYYYEPWAAGMLKADSNHVVGFRNWREAMLAGYRPDPISRPAPGAQIADLAALTRGDALTRYIEFVYAGQIAEASFNASYEYTKKVASLLSNYPHTRPLIGQTVDQILLASLGEGTIPTSVGGPPPVPAAVPGSATGSGGSGSGAMSGGSNPEGTMRGLQAGNTDKRSDEFTGFSSRAGKLANVPANH